MQKRTKRPLPHLRFEQIRHGVVGVARMQDQGQIGAPGGLDMGGQRAELVLARRIAVMEVQTGLANPDHLGMLSDFNEFVSRDVRAILGVMGMGADRAPDIVMTFGNRRNRFKIGELTADRDHPANPGRAGALDDIIEILGELLTVQVDVAVDQHVQAPAFSLRATSRTWPSALNIVCLGSR